MFTGIVEELGTVVEVRASGDGARLSIRGSCVTRDLGHGDSIAVNGVCLTVADREGEVFTADVMQVSLERSSLGALVERAPVNLERAATPNSRLGGHLVQGHVDAAARILARTPGDQWEVVRVELPGEVARYVVDKGSIAVDGVSLTVSAVGADWFEVSLIPTTSERTTLGSRGVGESVNLEVDVIAKHVERLLQERR